MLSPTHRFLVPTGVNDIRMLYIGTSSGIKNEIRAHHFTMLTLQKNLIAIREGTIMERRDAGKFFLNLMLGK